MKHLKQFNESKQVWVAALDDDYIYIPTTANTSWLYTGPDALPYFDTKEECQTWCDNNTYKGAKPTVDELDSLVDNILEVVYDQFDIDTSDESKSKILDDLFNTVRDMIKEWKEEN